MKNLWQGTLKTKTKHILPIEKSEVEDNWASSGLNVLIIQIFKEYNRRET